MGWYYNFPLRSDFLCCSFFRAARVLVHGSSSVGFSRRVEQQAQITGLNRLQPVNVEIEVASQRMVQQLIWLMCCLQSQ